MASDSSYASTEYDYENEDPSLNAPALDFGSAPGPFTAGGADDLADSLDRIGSISSTTSGSSLFDLPAVTKTDYTCTTSDGVRLHLVRGSCAGAAAERPREHPVVMVPGLASSGQATFDITPEYSLFDHLARQGYDVWVVDLRGNGRSAVPNKKPFKGGWCVDDHLFRDLPALMDLILEETGAEQVHWIGHSMGGMLATGALSLQGHLSRRIRSVAMMGSGCYGAGSWHSVLKPLLLAVCYWGFPAAFAASAYSRLVGTWASVGILESLFYWKRNIEPDVAKKLMGTCFHYIPRGLVYQFMDSINTPQGLTTTDGSLRYCDPKVLAHVTAPVLGVTGDWDLFCPAPGGLRTVMSYGGPCRRFVFLGPEYGTSKEHYGHFDVIMGRNARQEVWPIVTSFLEEHDSPVVVDVVVAASEAEEVLSEVDRICAAVGPREPAEAGAAGGEGFSFWKAAAGVGEELPALVEPVAA